MKNIFILLFAFGLIFATTSTVLAQANSDDTAGASTAPAQASTDDPEAIECRPLLTPGGAPPDTETCVETTGQIVANYRGQTASNIDRFQDTAGAKKAYLKARKDGNSNDGKAQESDK